MSYKINNQPGGYNPDEGMDQFQNYYARNTGLSASHKAPRPAPLTTPVFRGNGIQGLFQMTTDLPYYNGKQEEARAPLGDTKTNKYNTMAFQKEKCGCSGSSGVRLPPPV